MVKARPKTAYELKIDGHIPAAVEIANKLTLDKYPKFGPGIVHGQKHPEYVKLSQIGRKEREPYFAVIDFWNREYHAAMNRLCRDAGLR